MDMREVVVVSATRTPIGAIGGTLKDLAPEELLRVAMQAAISRTGIEVDVIDEVIAGQAKQTTDAPNIARVVSLMLRIPESVPGYTVHRQCASGMQAILNGMQQIICGNSDVVLVGGVESMSTAPFYIRNARLGVGNGNTEFVDPNTESQPKSQPQSIYGTFTMIQTADNVARQFKVSRQQQDEFALLSQQRAIRAMDDGKFDAEMVPVELPQRKGSPKIFSTDEYPKRDTDMMKLGSLNPIMPDGFVTAGNASGRNDGAAAMMLMEKEAARRLGLRPLVRILAGTAVGVDPRIMGIGPVAATHKLLKMLESRDIRLSDFSLFEINEAFAAQAVACIQELGLEPEQVNVNGGAIALGHPLGCSGVRIATTLIQEMHKRDTRLGMASICVAGGLGMAMAFEKI
jgi:acetyl-CoA C-acetyltransferase